jgi:hypothetical protein
MVNADRDTRTPTAPDLSREIHRARIVAILAASALLLCLAGVHAMMAQMVPAEAGGTPMSMPSTPMLESPAPAIPPASAGSTEQSVLESNEQSPHSGSSAMDCGISFDAVHTGEDVLPVVVSSTNFVATAPLTAATHEFRVARPPPSLIALCVSRT